MFRYQKASKYETQRDRKRRQRKRRADEIRGRCGKNRRSAQSVFNMWTSRHTRLKDNEAEAGSDRGRV